MHGGGSVSRDVCVDVIAQDKMFRAVGKLLANREFAALVSEERG
jgi:hypothetical protein